LVRSTSRRWCTMRLTLGNLRMGIIVLCSAMMHTKIPSNDTWIRKTWSTRSMRYVSLCSVCSKSD
jgi:hypothetical protein